MIEEAMFSPEERRKILALVRSSIEAYLANSAEPEIPDLNGKLAKKGACFVTLHTADGNLRGCIGSLVAMEPLGVNLQRHALNAAFNDPRFSPVDIDELAELEIEVSVLSEPETIADPEDFVVGKHGIILNYAGRSAVFLPQVAPEQGWDRETTFRYLCQKAGVPTNAWREPGAKLSVFHAEVFGES